MTAGDLRALLLEYPDDMPVGLEVAGEEYDYSGPCKELVVETRWGDTAPTLWLKGETGEFS